jgi:hypothetical protein
MPVEKFRSHEAARQALHVDRDDPGLAERIHRHWMTMRQLADLPPFPRGVHKYRTVEEAQAERWSFEVERARRLRRERTEGC